MLTRPRPYRRPLWLLPGLLCLLAAVPTGLAAILIASDEARAARPLQVAACGLVFGGGSLTTLATARVVYALGRGRGGPPERR